MLFNQTNQAKIKGMTSKNIYQFLWVMVIIGVGIKSILSARMPYAIPDELGYWAVGAWINRVDWSSVLGYSGYYGWGYGVILAPFFNVSDPVVRFKCAIGINIVLCLLIFGIIQKILLELLDDVREDWVVCASGVACVYVYISVFMRTTMSEIFLTFLFSLSVLCLLKFEQTHKVFWGCVFCLCEFGLFATHMRALACLFASICVIGAYAIKEKKIVKSLFIVVVLAILILCVFYIKKQVIISQYTIPQVAERNTVNESVARQLSFLYELTFEAVKGLFFSALGKFYYLLLASSFFAMGGFVFLCRSFFFKNICWKNKPLFITKMYILIVIIFAFGIDVIYMRTASRIDCIFYGRYFDYVMPLLCATGIICFLKVSSHRRTAQLVLITFVIAKLIYYYLSAVNITACVPINFPAMAIWIKAGEEIGYGNIVFGTLILNIGVLVIFLFASRGNKCIACVIAGFLWVIMANKATDIIYSDIDGRIDTVLETSNYVSNLEVEDIYIVLPDSVSVSDLEYVNYGWLQFAIGDKGMKTYSMDELLRRENDNYIIVCTGKYYLDCEDEIIHLGKDFVYQNDLFMIAE